MPARSSHGAQLGTRAAGFLVMDNVVARKSTGRYRAASAREVARSSHRLEAVVMFVLVGSVRKQKLLDLQGALTHAAATLPQLLAEEWS